MISATDDAKPYKIQPGKQQQSANPIHFPRNEIIREMERNREWNTYNPGMNSPNGAIDEKKDTNIHIRIKKMKNSKK